MNVLILGSNGQLGRSISKIFSGYLDKYEYSKNQLSILDQRNLLKVFKEINPDMVINCAAFTKVDLAEKEKKKALEVNSEGARNLALISNDFNATLIHFSTDYVYDGEKETPYLESDNELPLNYYGLTKKCGDYKIMKNCKKYFIFRLSGVFSPYGENFVKSMLRLRKNKSIRVVNDQFLKPTSARVIAKFLLKNLENNKFETAPYGLYNFSLNGSPMSWNEFAKLIFLECASLDLLDKVPKVNMTSSVEFGALAVRPSYSVLDNSKIRENFLFPEEDFKEALKRDLQLIFSTI